MKFYSYSHAACSNNQVMLKTDFDSNQGEEKNKKEDQLVKEGVVRPISHPEPFWRIMRATAINATKNWARKDRQKKRQNIPGQSTQSVWSKIQTILNKIARSNK